MNANNGIPVEIMLIVLLGGIAMYVAFVNPALGVAIGVGVVVAVFAWQLIKGR